MTLAQDLKSALSQDDLAAARGLAAARVKTHPRDVEARMFLAELCVIAGELDRAETHAKLAATAAPDAAVGLGVFRQHLRALHARDAWWTQGALPTFPTGPSALSALALRLNIALRDEDGAAAAKALAALDDLRGEQPVVYDGTEAGDLRDLDDRLPHAIEALSAGGHYLWLDFAQISELAFHPASRPIDMVLRRARVTLQDGSAADIRVPAIYPEPRGGTSAPNAPASAAPADIALRLGRGTDFLDLPGGLTGARGLRCWLAGDRVLTCHEAQTLGFPPVTHGGAEGAMQTAGSA
ncbi:nitrogen fixation protein [Mesobaculum littorinae]|uniref:Nitrogen fixation protein n=1 Tax=Mesobaculum littorinae TaxID=2486419 RepID=A0A438AI49_9RHOB|nr:type VI secretion system accessory protein TagJ [Mesobaculum littorinae]RVV98305.1 nitrogen fixation protein [Mesobaculum littorinae]